MTNDEQLAKAVRAFFARTPQLCPEAMILELEFLRDSATRVCEKQPDCDVCQTAKLLHNLAELIEQCSGELEKA